MGESREYVQPNDSVIELPQIRRRDQRARGSRLSLSLRVRLLEMLRFGAVGGSAFVVDIGIYNLLRLTILDDKPIGAKVISVAVATIVAWIGNRHFTFKNRGQRPMLREGLLFAAFNVVGLGISAGCLFFSHYVLGFTSTLADNIAGNVIGLGLGMIFRYCAYRFIVFRPTVTIDTPATPAPARVTTP